MSQIIEKKSVTDGQFYKAQETISTDSGDVTVKDTTTFNEAGGITSESTDVFLAGTNLSFGQIGSIFGSTIGRQLTDDTLGSIALGTVLGAIGQNLAQVIGLSAIGEEAFGDAVDTALDDIGLDLKTAGIGAISSFLVGELLSEIGLEGPVGEVVNTSAGGALTTIVNNLAGGATSSTEIFSGVNPANIVGGFVGAKLASQVISTNTVGGAILSSAGGAIGGYIGSLVLPGVGTAIGSFVGQVSGALIAKNPFLAFAVLGPAGVLLHFAAKLFGTPRSGADVLFNADTGEFGVSNVWSRKGGSKETARGFASLASANLNGILDTIGGTVVNEGRLSGGTYGTRNSDFTYRVDGGSYGPGDPGKRTISRTFDGDVENAATLLIEHGVVNALKDLQISGGDVFRKRALNGSLDMVMAGNNVKADIQGEALNLILGNFLTAGDYRTYIENAEVINALILAEPESAFAAGWIITLQRVSEIGLNKRHTSDWLGGYNAWAVSNEVQSLGALSINPYINAAGQSDRRFILSDENGFTRRIYDTVTQSSKDVISGTLGADVITITGDVLTGNGALTINGLVSDGSAFEIDIAATVHGGDGDDVIQGGDLGNDIFGDGGNDVITGGLKDDWIFGGAGNDKLYAGGGNGNYLSGEAGNDELYGATGSDWLEGGSGIDILRGNAGDDVLSGGAGAGDQLFGGSGDDSYILRLGDGADIIDDKADDPVAAPTQSIKSIIEDRSNGILARNWAGIEQLSFAGSGFVESGRISGGQDTLIMGAGIGLGDITIARSVGGGGALGNDLIVKVLVGGVLTGDQVTLTNWFDDYSRIEKLEFADGQVINIGNFATFTLGTDGADYIIGTAGNDFVHGGSGDDVIFLLWGNDVKAAIQDIANDNYYKRRRAA